MEGKLGPLCLCCGCLLGSLEEGVGLGYAELKLEHGIAEPILGVLRLTYKNMAKIAAWVKSSLKQACLRYEQPDIKSLEKCWLVSSCGVVLL